MKKTWVQDVLCADLGKIIDDFNARLAFEHDKHPKGSRYVKGVPKENWPEYCGIYFEDPTAVECVL